MDEPAGTLAAARSERRRSPRYPFEGVLTIEWGSALLEGVVRDISAEGMRVETPDPLWLGASFAAELALDTPLRVDCVVRRVEPGQGMGVALIVPEEADRARLEVLLATLAQK